MSVDLVTVFKIVVCDTSPPPTKNENTYRAVKLQPKKVKSQLNNKSIYRIEFFLKRIIWNLQYYRNISLDYKLVSCRSNDV